MCGFETDKMNRVLTKPISPQRCSFSEESCHPSGSQPAQLAMDEIVLTGPPLKEHPIDVLADSRTTRMEVRSVNSKNDGHEEESIHGTADHRLP